VVGNLRLPIEDDWRRKRQEQAGEKGDYDQHVNELAIRLYEPHMEARKQSKLSHELAKNHYDKRIHEIQLKKGRYRVFVQPTAKRGRIKEFEYKYQGPYMILEKISPLIYKLQIEECKFIIVHVNRLKQAYKSPKLRRDTSGTEEPRLSRKKETPRQSEPRRSEITDDSLEEEGETQSIRVDEVEENEGRDTDDESIAKSPTQENQRHSEWTPKTRYLQRKISTEINKSLERTHEIPYALRSRSTRTQSQEEGN
jgi:hypothetical protein